MSQLPEDPRRRKAAIASFVSALSPWELLDLRRQFRENRLVVRLAGLQDLPPEIVGEIGLLLPLLDLLDCRMVCKEWHKTWSQPAVSRLICRYRFPGLLGMYPSVQDPTDLLIKASKRYLRTRMCFEDPVHVDWDGDHNPVSHEESHIAYADGLLAWQAESDDDVYVGDLRSSSHRHVKFGASLLSGFRLKLKAISMDLLVMLQDDFVSHRVLHIHHLQLGETKKATLPARLETCYVNKGTVVLVTQPGAAFVWTWDGGLVTLREATPAADTDAKGRQAQPIPGVLFHPVLEDVIFLVRLLFVPKHAAPDALQEYTLEVTKYEKRQPTQRYERRIPHLTSELDRHSIGANNRPLCERDLFDAYSKARGQVCQRINNSGVYMLMLHGFEPNGSTSPAGLPMNRMAETEWFSECFDVMSETFHRFTYKLAPTIRSEIEEVDSCPSTSYFSFKSAAFLDDEMVVKISPPELNNGLGIKHSFSRYTVSRIDGHEIAPALATHPREDYIRGCHHGPTLLFLDEGILVLVSTQSYNVVLSEPGTL